MLILLDNNVLRPLRHLLRRHIVRTAFQMNWATLENGDLLAAAKRASFDLLVTADQNLQYQQNLAGRRISIVVLGSAQWPHLSPFRNAILDTVERAAPGSYAFVSVALPPKSRSEAS